MKKDERAWVVKELAELIRQLATGEDLDLAAEFERIDAQEVLKLEVLVPRNSCGDYVIDVLEELGCEIS